MMITHKTTPFPGLATVLVSLTKSGMSIKSQVLLESQKRQSLERQPMDLHGQNPTNNCETVVPGNTCRIPPPKERGIIDCEWIVSCQSAFLPV
jgi:hypothetical protein